MRVAWNDGYGFFPLTARDRLRIRIIADANDNKASSSGKLKPQWFPSKIKLPHEYVIVNDGSARALLIACGSIISTSPDDVKIRTDATPIRYIPITQARTADPNAISAFFVLLRIY